MRIFPPVLACAVILVTTSNPEAPITTILSAAPAHPGISHAPGAPITPTAPGTPITPRTPTAALAPGAEKTPNAKSTTDDVHWSTASWSDVLARAKAENRHVFVDFYATWCGPCKRLDKITYRNARVKEFLNSTVPVKYDAEKGVGLELARKYRVAAYPTLIVIAPDGKEVDRSLGYLEPEEFLTTMKKFVSGVETVRWYENKLKESPNSIEVLRTLGDKYVDAGRANDAERVLSRVLELDATATADTRAKTFYQLGEVNYTRGVYERARNRFLRVVTEFPSSKWYEPAVKRLAYTEYKLDHETAAVDRMESLIDRHPDDVSTLNAFAWFCAQRKIGLDRALPVAIRAAEKSGRDPGVLDTLAEVHFARGEYDKAIAVEKEASAKQPADTYLKDQIKKYRTARGKASSRASNG